MRGLAVTLLFVLLAGGAGAAGTPASEPVLTRCADVRALRREDAARQLPVEVRGVVTLLPAQPGSFTLDDGAGVWVELVTRGAGAALRKTLRVGDVVEVSGVSHEGEFAPTIAAHAVRVVGRSAVPAAQPLQTLGIGSTRYGCQRVTVDGVVQAAERVKTPAGGELRLLVSTSVGRFNYVLVGRNALPGRDLVDAEVSLTGVLICEFNRRRQFLGVRVLSNTPEELKVTRYAGDDPFAAPAVAMMELLNFSPVGIDPHRRRVTGTVTYCSPGQYFFLQEGRYALRVASRQPDALVPGDVVEAAGFLRIQDYRAQMGDAVFRKVGRGMAPEPIDLSGRPALAEKRGRRFPPARDYDDCLVTLRARLVSVEHVAGGAVVLNLETRGEIFPAAFNRGLDAGAAAGLRPGSELRVTGIGAITFPDSHDVLDWPRPARLQLLLRGPDDVQVVRAASWWTPARLWTALGATVAVLLAALGWSVWLRRTVALRSAQLAEEIRARRDAAVEFESTLRERNRLAADLHDTLEQALTGLAFQLEASDALRTQSPESSGQHLALARQVLARSREDLRRSIWNLRATPLEQHTLGEALQAIAADRSAGQAARIEVACEGEARPLPDLVAGNMLLLAQEGITNALKHAGPALIELKLSFTSRSVRLQIRDDGRGFDPAKAAGAKDGHFGLQGMHERAKRLGGTFTIESAPERGTLITVTVPMGR